MVLNDKIMFKLFDIFVIQEGYQKTNKLDRISTFHFSVYF